MRWDEDDEHVKCPFVHHFEQKAVDNFPITYSSTCLMFPFVLTFDYNWKLFDMY